MMLLSLAALSLTVGTTAGAQDHPFYEEEGSSGPGLYRATRLVTPISVVRPDDPQHFQTHAICVPEAGHRIAQNPASRFAVVLWCEDALGNQVGIRRPTPKQ
jgi:hypothetical protein